MNGTKTYAGTQQHIQPQHTHVKGLPHTTQSLEGRSDFETVLLVLPPTPPPPLRRPKRTVGVRPNLRTAVLWKSNPSAVQLNFAKSAIQATNVDVAKIDLNRFMVLV